MPDDTSIENLDIKLKYSGRDVDDGSMSVEDFIEAVQGFSGTYGRIASLEGSTQNHKIRITGIERGSVDIILIVKQIIDHVNKHSTTVGNIQLVGGAITAVGFGIFKSITWLIKLVKHVKKKPHTTQIKDATTVIVKNYENIALEMPINIYNIYKNNEGSIKNDLYKITRPLEVGVIDEVVLEAKANGQNYSEIITASEKSYFDPKEDELTETDAVWIQGSFNSLTKSTHKGFFYLTDGSRVSYEFIGDNPGNLHTYFLHKGLVKVKAIVHLDQNLKPIKLDIDDVEVLQLPLSFEPIDIDE